MDLVLESPRQRYALRGADGSTALVNARRMERSFIVSPLLLIEEWAVGDVTALTIADLEPLLAFAPELLVIGSGAIQGFPPPETMAACLARGIGIESMTNAAAARTFNVLAAEERRFVAGFILSRDEPSR